MKKILLLLFIVVALSCLLISCDSKECVHSYQSATCTTPKTCSLCGTTDGDVLEHSWAQPNCLSPKTCKLCKITEGEAFGHNWSTNNCSALKKCTRCGISGERKEHTWDTTECLKTPVCTVCSAEGEEISHSWKIATCTDPIKCDNCGTTNGSPKGHSWQVISCAEPKVCKNCNESSVEDLPHKWTFMGCEEKRVCSVCQKSEEEKIGHTWVEATCKLVKHCSTCDVTEGELAEHTWSEATCATPKRCNGCGLIEGTSLEHDWKMIKNIKACCEDGLEVFACTYCKSEISHTYNAIYYNHICDENGLCSRCNMSFDPKKMVIDSVLIENEFSIPSCGIFHSSETKMQIYKPVTSYDIGMPVVNLTGTLPSAKDNYKNTVEFSYESEDLTFNCYAQINVQGASSQWKEKKNYNIKLVDVGGNKNKMELVESWGKESKYCMKANYIDYSQSRNVVSGKIFGEIVKSRNDELKDTPNGGAIDGYPILVYHNGKYLGIYTMNIPKDNWMFDMSHSDEKNQAIIMTNDWTKAVSFRELPPSNWHGFVLEYASNEESKIDSNTQWAYDSLLELIKFVLNNDGADFKKGIHKYADVDKCIDSMIYTFFICADDNTSKNILWVTLDGKVWFSSMYDMDGTWGMRWNGNIEFDEDTYPISILKDGKGFPEEREGNTWVLNLLWEKIYINYFDLVCERYMELRQDILTIENITAHFTSFYEAIPDVVRQAEREKWRGVPSQSLEELGYSSHLEQILTFAEKRLEVFDKILIPEKAQT